MAFKGCAPCLSSSHLVTRFRSSGSDLADLVFDTLRPGPPTNSLHLSRPADDRSKSPARCCFAPSRAGFFLTPGRLESGPVFSPRSDLYAVLTGARYPAPARCCFAPSRAGFFLVPGRLESGPVFSPRSDLYAVLTGARFLAPARCCFAPSRAGFFLTPGRLESGPVFSPRSDLYAVLTGARFLAPARCCFAPSRAGFFLTPGRLESGPVFSPRSDLYAVLTGARYPAPARCCFAPSRAGRVFTGPIRTLLANCSVGIRDQRFRFFVSATTTRLSNTSAFSSAWLFAALQDRPSSAGITSKGSFAPSLMIREPRSSDLLRIGPAIHSVLTH